MKIDKKTIITADFFYFSFSSIYKYLFLSKVAGLSFINEFPINNFKLPLLQNRNNYNKKKEIFFNCISLRKFVIRHEKYFDTRVV